MQCAACGCRVHPHCYGYLLKPAAPWLCCVCEDIASTLLHLPHGDVSPATLSSITPLRRRVRCCLCGIAAGAMVATPVPGVYAHVCCGVWLKECAISNHAPLGRSAFDAFFLSPRHFPLVVNPAALRRPSASQGSDLSPCQFCGRTGGVVCCQRSGCERCFHVMCGYARGLELDFRVSAALRSDFRDCVLLSARHTHLCAQHAAEVFEGEVPWDVRVDEVGSGDGKVDGEVSGDGKPSGEVSGDGKPSGEAATTQTPSGEAATAEKTTAEEVERLLWAEEAPTDMATATLADLTCFPATTASEESPVQTEKPAKKSACEQKQENPPDDALPFSQLLARRAAAGALDAFDDLLELPAALLAVQTPAPAVMVHSRSHSGRRRKTPELVDGVSVLDIREFGTAPCDVAGRAPVTAVRRREPKSSETPAKERAAKPAETKTAETKTIEAKAAPVKKRRPPKRTSPAKETPAPPAKKQLYKSLILYHPDGVQKLPPSPFDSFSPRQISRSPAVLLDAFCQSPHFTQLFSQTPTLSSADDVSPRGYLAHYYCGVTSKVLEACLQGDLDVEAVIASGDKPTEGLEAVLAWLPRCAGPVERVCVLRVLLLSALCSVYPPQVVATASARKGSMLARSATVEVRHLSQVSRLLGELAVELSNVVMCLTDPKDYARDRARANFAPQCLCLEEKVKDPLVCASCGVCYHSECLGLQQTAYSDLVQTKMYGYWSLERGFVCPKCCSGDLFEMSRVVKGEVQVRDSVLITWQAHEKKKRK